MNEKDLEKRLRDVVDGPQPSAPSSLHRFLRELPETQSARRRGPLDQLRNALYQIPALVAPQPFARRAQLAFGVALAVLIGITGGGLLLSIRTTSVAPLASGSPGSPAPWVTPRQSTSTHQPPVEASLGIANMVCAGVPVVDNESMALPVAAIVSRAGKYLGVNGGAYGTSGLVHSGDGLYWDWSPPTTVDAKAAVLTSIASDTLNTIVVTGGVQGVDGTVDGRIWISADDGTTWQAIPNESVFRGVTVQLVVYGSGQYIALGWNTTSPADSLRQIAEWRSVDGRTWTHVTTPIKGTAALIVSTAAGFVLSGAPLTTGAIDEPPMWHSSDGQTWTRARANDNTAQLMGPLVSATVTGLSHVYGVSASSDGVSHQLVASYDGGLTWKSVKPDVTMLYAPWISQVASLNTTDAQGTSVEYVFVATAMNIDANAHVWASANGGVTWVRVNDPKVGGPTGTSLLELGHGYQAGGQKILSFGDPGSGLGIWLIQTLTSP